MDTMKVTALIPDGLVKEIKVYAQGKNLTESLIVALSEWRDLQKIRELNEEIAKKPLEFVEGFSAKKVREINRQR